jgi:urate oxidase
VSLSLFRDRYGESGVRLVKVSRRGDRHEVKDLTVDVAVAGEFDATYITGDNRKILPADSMKNTVYALAEKHGGGEIEEFALALTQYFIVEHEQLSEVTATVKEHRWSRIAAGGRPHDTAFSRNGDDKRIALATRTRDGCVVEAGIEDLLILKTKHSGFEGYLHDRFTTLRETDDRLLAAVLNARWRYGWGELPYGLHWQQVRQVILDTFAEHDSRSLQHTLYAMAQAGLEQCPPIVEIHFSLHHRQHLLADLTPFGLANENAVFVPSLEPFGIVEATVRREELPG